MTEPRMSGTKRCSRCGEEKPVLAFAVDKRHSDGLMSHCRSCHVKAVKKDPAYGKARVAAAGRARRFLGKSED